MVLTPFAAWWSRALASPLYLKHPQSERSVPCGSIAPDYRIPGQTGGLLSAFATCIHCPPGRDNSSSTCGGLESTKRQRNRRRAYVPLALSHLDCSAPNGQMIVWSNGHPTHWRERSIARGNSQESHETTGDPFSDPARQGGSRLDADRGSTLGAD